MRASIERALAASEREHRESVDHAAWLAFVPPIDDALERPLLRRGRRSEPHERPDPERACPGCGDTGSPHLSRCDYCATGYLHEVDDGFSCCQCASVLAIGIGGTAFASLSSVPLSDVSIEEALDQAAYDDWRKYGDPIDGDLV